MRVFYHIRQGRYDKNGMSKQRDHDSHTDSLESSPVGVSDIGSEQGHYVNPIMV